MNKILDLFKGIHTLASSWPGAFIVFTSGSLLLLLPALALNVGGFIGDGVPIINRIAASICLSLIVGQIAMWYNLMRYW